MTCVVALVWLTASTTWADRTARREHHSRTDVDCAEVQRDLNAAITRGDPEFALPAGDIRCDVDFVVLGKYCSNNDVKSIKTRDCIVR